MLASHLLLACLGASPCPAQAAAADVHNRASAIPPMWFDVTAHGAIADGNSLCTQAIQKAIDAAGYVGGGTVYFPPGTYVSGTIFLRDHVTLQLEAGATLRGSTRLADYPSVEPGFRSYTDTYVHQCLISGENVENITITGRGTIDGQGAHENFDPAGPDWGYRRRPYVIRLVTCRDILIENITLRDSPMWMQHYLACDNLTVRGVTVRSRCNANNDGINIDCCHNVRIADCDISSGDDAIVLKSTADRACENVTITNCIVSSNCNGLKMGTETNGGFRNIAISNCSIYDVRLAGLTLQIVDGGTLDRVAVTNLTMHNVDSPIFLRLGREFCTYIQLGNRTVGREAALQRHGGPLGIDLGGIQLLQVEFSLDQRVDQRVTQTDLQAGLQ